MNWLPPRKSWPLLLVAGSCMEQTLGPWELMVCCLPIWSVLCSVIIFYSFSLFLWLSFPWISACIIILWVLDTFKNNIKNCIVSFVHSSSFNLFKYFIYFRIEVFFDIILPRTLVWDTSNIWERRSCKIQDGAKVGLQLFLWKIIQNIIIQE